MLHSYSHKKYDLIHIHAHYKTGDLQTFFVLQLRRKMISKVANITVITADDISAKAKCLNVITATEQSIGVDLKVSL